MTNYELCGICEKHKKLKHRNNPWYNYGYCPIFHKWKHNYDMCEFQVELERIKYS